MDEATPQTNSESEGNFHEHVTQVESEEIEKLAVDQALENSLERGNDAIAWLSPGTAEQATLGAINDTMTDVASRVATSAKTLSETLTGAKPRQDSPVIALSYAAETGRAAGPRLSRRC